MGNVELHLNTEKWSGRRLLRGEEQRSQQQKMQIRRRGARKRERAQRERARKRRERNEIMMTSLIECQFIVMLMAIYHNCCGSHIILHTVYTIQSVSSVISSTSVFR